MDNILADHAVMIVGLVGLFIISLFVYTSPNDSQRRKFSKWYFLSIAVCFGIIYYIEHSNKLSPASIDAYRSCVGISVAWPYIIAQVFVRRRYGRPIIRLKPSLYDNTITIIAVIFMIYIACIYAPSYYAKMSWWNLIFFMLFAISMTLAIPVMNLQMLAFYKGVISHCGFLWAWSDFESYSWKDRTLLLQRRKGRPVRLAVRPEDRQAVEDFLATHIPASGVTV